MRLSIYDGKRLTRHLQDIIHYASNAVEYTQSLTYEEFVLDNKTIDATIKSLEVVGEATRHIPNSFRNKHSNIPWKRITGMRDKLIHDYTGVDLEIVWKTASKDIPKLLEEINKIL